MTYSEIELMITEIDLDRSEDQIEAEVDYIAQTILGSEDMSDEEVGDLLYLLDYLNN